MQIKYIIVGIVIYFILGFTSLELVNRIGRRYKRIDENAGIMALIIFLMLIFMPIFTQEFSLLNKRK